jgi:hypothetical protein
VLALVGLDVDADVVRHTIHIIGVLGINNGSRRVVGKSEKALPTWLAELSTFTEPPAVLTTTMVFLLVLSVLLVLIVAAFLL